MTGTLRDKSRRGTAEFLISFGTHILAAWLPSSPRQTLAEVLRDSSGPVRDLASRVLCAMGEPAVAELTLLLRDATRLGGAQPPRRLVHQLRLRKSAAEQVLMRRAGAVGAQAMAATMVGSVHAARRGLTEAVLAATFEFESKVGGAERLAYPCVVAGGANAVTLHYMQNASPLRGGE